MSSSSPPVLEASESWPCVSSVIDACVHSLILSGMKLHGLKRSSLLVVRPPLSGGSRSTNVFSHSGTHSREGVKAARVGGVHASGAAAPGVAWPVIDVALHYDARRDLEAPALGAKIAEASDVALDAVALPVAVLQLWQEGALKLDAPIEAIMAQSDDTSPAVARCTHMSPAQLLAIVGAPVPDEGKKEATARRLPTAGEARHVLEKVVEQAAGTSFASYVEKRVIHLRRDATAMEKMRVLLRALVLPLFDSASDHGLNPKGGGEGVLSVEVLNRLHRMAESVTENGGDAAGAASGNNANNRLGLGFRSSALWHGGPRVLWQHHGGGAADGGSSLLFVLPSNRLAFWLVTSSDLAGRTRQDSWNSRSNAPLFIAHLGGASAHTAPPMSSSPDRFTAEVAENFATQFLPHLAGTGSLHLRADQCSPISPSKALQSGGNMPVITTVPRTSEWLQPLPPHRSDPAIELLVFPCAGASAPGAYEAWSASLPSYVQVHAVLLPMRGARAGENMPCENLEELAHFVALAARSVLSSNKLHAPYVLFGHGFGALLAYEFALQARDILGRAPVALFVSGAECPGFRKARQTAASSASESDAHGAISSLGSEAALQVHNATRASRRVPTHLRANPLMLRAMANTLQSDLLMEERYLDTAQYPPLQVSCPVHAFAGADDSEVSEEALVAWEEVGAKASTSQRVSGDHHYLDDTRTREHLIASLVQLLTEQLAPSRASWVERLIGFDRSNNLVGANF